MIHPLILPSPYSSFLERQGWSGRRIVVLISNISWFVGSRSDGWEEQHSIFTMMGRSVVEGRAVRIVLARRHDSSLHAMILCLGW